MRLVIATAGTSLYGVARRGAPRSSEWEALRDAVRVSAASPPGSGPSPWRIELVDREACAVAQSALRRALNPQDGIPPSEAKGLVTAEVGGMFGASGPLARAARDEKEQQSALWVAPVTESVRAAVLASDTSDGVHAAVVVALLLADDVEVVVIGSEETGPPQRLLPPKGLATTDESSTRAPAPIAAVRVLIISGLDATKPEVMSNHGLANLGLGLRQAIDARPDGVAPERIDLGLSAGFKAVVAQAPVAIGLLAAARRDSACPLPPVRMFTTFEPSADSYGALEYAAVEVDLLASHWAELRRLCSDASHPADPAVKARLGPLLIRPDGRITRFGRTLVDDRFPPSEHHPLIDELAQHGATNPDPRVVVEKVRLALDGLERDVEDGELRGRMRDIYKPFEERLLQLPGDRAPDAAWLIGAEQLVAQSEAREAIRSLRLVPVNELAYQVAIARLRAGASAIHAGGVAEAAAAVNRWVELLRGGSGPTFAPPYPHLNRHAETVVAAINALGRDKRDDRNRLLDSAIRGARLPQFQLTEAYRAVDGALRGASKLAWRLARLLALGGPVVVVVVLACAAAAGCEPVGWWAIIPGATLALAVVLTCAVAHRVGIAAAHALAPRLLGSCLIGAIVLVGLGDLITPVLRAVVADDVATLAVSGGLLVLALGFTTMYLLIELSVNAIPTGDGLRTRLPRAAAVSWLGLQYALAAGCLVAPIRGAALTNDAIGVIAALDEPLTFGPIVVVSSLALVIGVLTQLFWQDRTAVDPL